MMVPPMHSSRRTREDHMATKDWAPPREERADMATMIWTMERKMMQYHHPAISLREDPSQRAVER